MRLMAIVGIGGLTLSGLGCQSGGSNAAEAALINTTLAVGVSAVRRGYGECFTVCTPGNECNPKTGLCDPLPCRGECMQGEICDESGLFPRCLSAAQPELTVLKPAPAPQASPPSDLPRALPPPD